MIKDLVKLANHLDNIGEIKLASELDAIIKMAQALVPYVPPVPVSPPSTALVPVYETIEGTLVGESVAGGTAAGVTMSGILLSTLNFAGPPVIATALAKYVLAPLWLGLTSGEPSEGQKRIYRELFGSNYSQTDIADLKQYAGATFLINAGPKGLFQQAIGSGKGDPNYKMLIKKTFVYAINRVRKNKGMTPLDEEVIMAIMRNGRMDPDEKVEAAAQAVKTEIDQKVKDAIRDYVKSDEGRGQSRPENQIIWTLPAGSTPPAAGTSPATSPAAKIGPPPTGGGTTPAGGGKTQTGGGKTQTGRGTTQTGGGTTPSYVYPVEKDPNGPVHEMQRALGFTPDLVDGKFGRKTLEKYQEATGQGPVSGDPVRSLEILKASLAAKAPAVAPTVAPTATEAAVVPSQTAESLEDVVMEIRPAKIYPQNYFIRRYPKVENIELINNPNGPMIGSEALRRIRQRLGVKSAFDNAEERINKMASEYESAIFSGDNAFFRRR